MSVSYPETRLHFISGLPRSGSTLLAALLCQNPAFTASVSSPVAPVFLALQSLLSARTEFHPFIDDRKRRAILRGLVINYFSDIEPGRVIFDTNRAWCSKADALGTLFPAAKLICCVRPLCWIFDSFERIIRRNALEPSRLFNYEAGGNVYTRVESLNHPQTGVIGSAYNGLREAFHGESNGRLVLVKYESLTRDPARTMRAIYEAIGEEPFEHNFDDVRFDSDSYDRLLGLPGLHGVRGRVQFVERTTILPPDLFKRFETGAFWLQDQESPNRVKVI
jgi:sulfotransferase